jgi:CrcB protein
MFGIIYCAVGGACGAVMRYWISGIAYRYLGAGFPWGTLAVNLLGSLIIGILWASFEASALPSHMRMLLFIGFLGAFTTFSTFALENFHLVRDGQFYLAAFNILSNNVLGIVLVFVGYFTTRALINSIT